MPAAAKPLGPSRRTGERPARGRPAGGVGRPLRLRRGISRKKSMSIFFESGSAQTETAKDATQIRKGKYRRNTPHTRMRSGKKGKTTRAIAEAKIPSSRDD